MDGVMFFVGMILTKSRKSKVTRMPADQTFDLFWGILINQMKVLILINIQAVPSSRAWEGNAAVERFKSEKPSRQPVVGIFWSHLSTTFTFSGWRVDQKSIMKSQGSHTMLNSQEGLVSCDTFVIVGKEGVSWNNSRKRHNIVENHHHHHDQVADPADQGGVWQELWPARGRGARGRGGGRLAPVSLLCVCFSWLWSWASRSS